jgi:ATP-dependent RNA helicase DDX10/DBP4
LLFSFLAAFLVPAVELLFRERWSTDDGLGVIIITPTRELAMQVFEVLRVLVKCHRELTAALLTGGKDADEEAKNVSVCTMYRFCWA